MAIQHRRPGQWSRYTAILVATASTAWQAIRRRYLGDGP